jgi:hypothetical protein
MNCINDSQKDSNDIIGIFRMFDFRYPGNKDSSFFLEMQNFCDKNAFFK